MQNWLSSEWFSISKFLEITWGRPYFLYLISIIPLLFLLKSIGRTRNIQGLPIATVNGELKLGWSHYLRILQPIFQSLALLLMIIALARPQISSQTQNKFSEGIDIILAIDISESMLNKDISPNRLEASKKIASEFINNRFQDRIGLVLFSGEAYSQSPLTTDYKALNDYITEIKTQLIPTEGTAIGSALAVSVSRLMNAKSKSKIIIIISDGDNTAGNLDPTTSAQIAKAYGVKIYSILVAGMIQNTSKDGQISSYNMSIDQQVLSEIAKIAEGKFFKATDSKSLKKVFDEINLLEKVKFLENSSSELIDVFSVYLKWGIVFFLMAFATKISFLGNILED